MLGIETDSLDEVGRRKYILFRDKIYFSFKYKNYSLMILEVPSTPFFFFFCFTSNNIKDEELMYVPSSLQDTNNYNKQCLF